MKIADVKKMAFGMPLTSPSFTRGPYRYVNREYLSITYRTDPAAIERILPEPLKAPDPVVKFQFIKMPDSTGFGEYRAAGQVIPVTFEGRRGNFCHALYLNAEAALAGGREIWGFPEKLGNVSFQVETDTLLGTLDYGRLRLATGTMGYKYKSRDGDEMAREFAEPNFLLKIVPHVDCTPRIIELVQYHFEDVAIHGAWTGPAGLSLSSHALAPVSGLPMLGIESSVHFVGDMTLGMGSVVHDYMK
jgi:acetoacetate decarboxylase